MTTRIITFSCLGNISHDARFEKKMIIRTKEKHSISWQLTYGQQLRLWMVRWEWEYCFCFLKSYLSIINSTRCFRWLGVGWITPTWLRSALIMIKRSSNMTNNWFTKPIRCLRISIPVNLFYWECIFRKSNSQLKTISLQIDPCHEFELPEHQREITQSYL